MTTVHKLSRLYSALQDDSTDVLSFCLALLVLQSIDTSVFRLTARAHWAELARIMGE